MNKIILAGLASSLIAGTVLMNDPLADLGLDLDNAGGAGGASLEAQPETEAQAEVVKQKREQVKIGELEFGFADFIPEQKRGGGVSRESKYDFAKLAAPQVYTKDDGTEGTRYSTFYVALLDGVDADALRRSVQSATTAANRGAKEDGEPNRYVTRQRVVDGEFVGIIVYRTDIDSKAE